MADSTSYLHSHRAFLQSFLSRTTHTVPTLKPILARILSIQEGRQVLENDITEADIISHMTVVNASISPYDLEIRQQMTQHGHRRDYADTEDDEEDARRVKVYALVNTTSDPVSQLATLKTPEEIAYLLRVLDCMFETQNSPTGRGGKEIMAVGHMQALQLHKQSNRDSQRRSSGAVNGNGESSAAAASSKKFTMVEAESVLETLVAEGWFEITPAPAERGSKYYILSPRALMELKAWLLEAYNEPPSDSAPPSDDSGSDSSPETSRARARGVERVKKCAACQEIVISGQRCGERRCGGRLHDACTGSYWRSRRGPKKCPECDREWSGVDFVGVRAVRGPSNVGRVSAGSSSRGGRTSTQGRQSSSSRAQTREVDEQEDEESE